MLVATEGYGFGRAAHAMGERTQELTVERMLIPLLRESDW